MCRAPLLSVLEVPQWWYSWQHVCWSWSEALVCMPTPNPTSAGQLCWLLPRQVLPTLSRPDPLHHCLVACCVIALLDCNRKKNWVLVGSQWCVVCLLPVEVMQLLHAIVSFALHDAAGQHFAFCIKSCHRILCLYMRAGVVIESQQGVQCLDHLAGHFCTSRLELQVYFALGGQLDFL